MANISGGRQLADEERELLVANWGPDPVHPGKGGYLKLATNLLSRIQGNAASAVSGGGQHLPVIKKRRWADEDGSVIVRHPQMFQGGGRGNLRGQWRRGRGRSRRNWASKEHAQAHCEAISPIIIIGLCALFPSLCFFFFTVLHLFIFFLKSKKITGPISAN